jgi:predicted  nucleic acid-binding Zn-ribbon protein
MKTCKRGHNYEPLSADNKNGCPACQKIRFQTFWYKASKEELLEEKQRKALWQKQNPEWRREYQNARRRATDFYKSEKHRAYVNEYNQRELPKAKRKARTAHYYHMRQGDFTAEQWLELKEYYQNRCAYCFDSVANLTMDHIAPLKKGGPHTKSNIAPACLSCNSSKRDKDLMKWLDL